MSILHLQDQALLEQHRRETHIRNLIEEEKRCQLELQIAQAQQELKQVMARNRTNAEYHLATRMAAQRGPAYPAGYPQDPPALTSNALPTSAASLPTANAGAPSTYPGGHAILCDESIDGKPYYQRNILTMAHHFDAEFLSEQMCFVRKQCLEVFVVSQRDVNERRYPGKAVAKQAGIRCRFCAHLDASHRGLRSTAFPSSAQRIYKSITMMLRDHFTDCAHMPPMVRNQLAHLRGKFDQSSKRSTLHWIQSAHDIGLYDTIDCRMGLGPPTRYQIMADTTVPALPPAAAAATTASLGAFY